MNKISQREDTAKFFVLYEEVREDIIRFELTSSKSPAYASGFLEKIRNALDDYIIGQIHNNDKKIANAEEHLCVAGCEAFEVILIDKMEEINDIVKKLDSFLGRMLYPRQVYNHIRQKMYPIPKNLTEARIYKSREYHKAKDAYQSGIRIADEILNEYYSWKIPGMCSGERRKEHMSVALIGIFSAIIGGLILWVLVHYFIN